jgi:hypothetical protein
MVSRETVFRRAGSGARLLLRQPGPGLCLRLPVLVLVPCLIPAAATPPGGVLEGHSWKRQANI